MIDGGRVQLGALFYPSIEQQTPAGRTVLLLHGWADSSWSMDAVAQPLARAGGNRVISLDLRGHGRSGRGPYNMVHLIGDLRGVVEALDIERPIIIGHSLGGQISAQFCGLYPDGASALVMVEGVGPPPHRLSRSDPAALERAATRRQVEQARRHRPSRPLGTPEDAARRLQQAHPLLDPARARWLATKNTVRNADGDLIWRFDPDSRDWLNGHHQQLAGQRWQGISCPVLVVNGADAHQRYWRNIGEDPADYPEPLTGDSLAERLSHFADVRYAEIDGAGHMLPYDKPDELNAVIAEFLAGLDQR